MVEGVPEVGVEAAEEGDSEVALGDVEAEEGVWAVEAVAAGASAVAEEGVEAGAVEWTDWTETLATRKLWTLPSSWMEAAVLARITSRRSRTS